MDSLKDKQVPKAILLNSDDWGYGHFTLDDQSLEVFEKSVSKLPGIDKAMVVHQIKLMINNFEYPASRLPVIREQFADETSQTTLDTFYSCLHKICFESYLPTEDIPVVRQETADFFLKKAVKHKDDAELSKYCVGKALIFSFSKDLLSKAAKWILDDKIAIGDDELKC